MTTKPKAISSLLETLPDVTEIRSRIAANHQERELLRRMLRVAEQKAQLEKYERVNGAKAN